MVTIYPELPDNSSLNSTKTGFVFLAWLRLMISNNEFAINRRNSVMYVMTTEFVGVLTPTIFFHFCDDYGLEESHYKKILNALQKTRVLAYPYGEEKNQSIFIGHCTQHFGHKIHVILIHKSFLFSRNTKLIPTDLFTLDKRPMISSHSFKGIIKNIKKKLKELE